MDSGTFLTLAELSLALVGFSAIVAVFLRREDQTLRAQFNTRQLVEIALTAFAMSLLPVLLAELRLSGDRLWQACSLAAAALVIAHVGAGLYRSRIISAIEPEQERPISAVAAAIVALILVLANLVNASGWLWVPSSGPYTASIMGQLGAASVFFVVEFFRIDRAPPGG